MDSQHTGALHHRLWDNCQIMSLPFCSLMFLYRLFFGVWNLDKYYIPETLGSHWELLRFYNLRNLPVEKYEEEKRKEKYKSLPELKRSFIDYCYFLYISTGIVYYYYDLFYRIAFVGIYNFSLCDYSYVLHHLTTIFNYKFYGSVHYFTWYLMFPSAYHAVLIAFPKFYWNYHFYGVSLALFTFSQIYFESLRSTRLHKYLIWSVPFLTPSLIMIAMGKCQ